MDGRILPGRAKLRGRYYLFAIQHSSKSLLLAKREHLTGMTRLLRFLMIHLSKQGRSYETQGRRVQQISARLVCETAEGWLGRETRIPSCSNAAAGCAAEGAGH